MIPTLLEKQLFVQADSQIDRWRILICGFGPISAAASAARLIQAEKPDAVVLAGVAGSLNEDEFAIGSARRFERFVLEGVGVGQSEQYLNPRDIDLPQWVDGESTKIYDEIDLSSGGNNSSILTVCAASGDLTHAMQRKARFPEAVAEDMESFGVALACVMASTPLIVVRGCSNVAGDRNKANWRMKDAADAVVGALAKIE